MGKFKKIDLSKVRTVKFTHIFPEVASKHSTIVSLIFFVKHIILL